VPQAHFLFGFPSDVSSGRFEMDLDNISTYVGSKTTNAAGKLAYLRESGAISSALEHSVPEQMFSVQTDPAKGVSAVKALNVALENGQNIYRITLENRDAALPLINTDNSTISEIRSSIDTGKTVFVHENPVNLEQWTGTGYIVLDPVTGDGAYKISGGLSGGWILSGILLIIAAILLLLVLFFAPFVLPAILWLATFFAAIAAFFTGLSRIDPSNPNNADACEVGVTAAGSAIGTLSASLPKNVGVLLSGMIPLFTRKIPDIPQSTCDATLP
jgi:hypothetical protein